jgi:hypothetical protein
LGGGGGGGAAPGVRAGPGRRRGGGPRPGGGGGGPRRVQSFNITLCSIDENKGDRDGSQGGVVICYGLSNRVQRPHSCRQYQALHNSYSKCYQSITKVLAKYYQSVSKVLPKC